MRRRLFIAVLAILAIVPGALIVTQTVSAESAAPPTAPVDTCSSSVDIASLLPGGANEDPDVAATNAEIDANFAAALRTSAVSTGLV